MDLTIDAGHGGKDPGAIGPTGVQEKNITLKLALKVGSLLTSKGVNVNYTRTDNRSVELSERAAFANATKARYFLSIHINSATNAAANGTETYAFASGGQGEKLAAAVQKNLVAAIGLTDRGVKFANYAVLRETDMPAALTEVNFICNPKEEAMLKDEAFLNKVASGIAKGVIEFLGLKWEVPPTPQPIEAQPDQQLTLIMGKTEATVAQMVAYALKGNTAPLLPNCTIEELAQAFIEEAEIEGVRADVAWAQSLKETGYFKYGGIVLPEQNNYSGIGALNSNSKGEAAVFESPRIGVRAQIQHLKAYASTESLKQPCVDPRFNLVKRGTAEYVEWLGYEDNPNGTGWAWPGKGYGYNIVGILKGVLQEPKESPIADQGATDSNIPQWQKDGFKKLVEKKVIGSPEAWEGRLGETITIGEVMGILANTL